MTAHKYPVNLHQQYHAHVYFDAQTLAFATELCHQVANRFGLTIGRVHQKLVGPHTKWSCQILFSSTDFDALIPWLDEHRDGLSVLVHADTGDDILDHTEYVYWLGEPVEIDLSGL